ncbi:MAG TPA: IPT/TIG domain-containing protein [Nitrospira sp.]|nr:IPT/TIG domain-containing protein [Nitrospira sp.]
MTTPFHLFFLLLSWLVVANVMPQLTLAEEGIIVDGAGYTLHDAESIKGHDEQTLEQDPVCDSSRKPKIVHVEPDEAKPGHTIHIKGENFGTQACFRGVAFSAAGHAKIDYKFVDDTTLEVSVPDIQPGMSFIDIVAGGGNARSKAFLVQPK